MAQPETVRGTKVSIMLGDGASAEVFEAFCGLTAQTINFQTNTNEDFVYDCDDPDSVPWRELTKSGRFLSLTGSGLLDKAALTRYRDAYDDVDGINAQIMIDDLGMWECAIMFTNLNITANFGERTQAEISLESTGPVEWSDA